MRIDHRRFNILVAEQLLHFPDIDAVHEQMCRETVAQRMHGRVFGNAGLPDCLFYYLLYGGVADMMASHPAAARVNREIVGRKNILPCPFFARVGMPQLLPTGHLSC